MSGVSEPQLRQQLHRYSRLLWEKGWVANHDGNLSARLPRGRLMCTPTALSKGDIAPQQMLVTDDTGKVLAGRLRPFSELNLHLAYYHARSDVGAVVHAHPPHATALGVSGVPLDQPFLPEAVVSLGPMIPTVPLAAPGEAAVQAMAPYIDEYDALLLGGNGAITCGVDLEMAFLRMELLEHLARIVAIARPVGGPQPLPATLLQPLLAARAKAGLGPEARGGRTTLPEMDTRPQSGPSARQLQQAVQDEIRRVLS